MTEILVHLLLLLGAIILLIAAIGVVRLPDIYMRLSAISKAITLGIGSMLLAVSIHFGELAVTTRCLLIILFFILTSPVSAHLIARSAFLVGVPFWEETFINDLAARRKTMNTERAAKRKKRINNG